MPANNQQVDGWLAAGEIELSASELERVAAAIETTGAGEGPVERRRVSEGAVPVPV